MIAIVAVALIGFLVVMSVNKELASTQSEDAISPSLSYKEKKAVTASRLSAVRIVSMSLDGSGLSSMSGTYLTTLGRHYVLTVAHGIAGPCELTKVLVDSMYYDCISYVTVDLTFDYAIMEVEKIPVRTPISIVLETPAINSAHPSQTSILSKVYYTGYPNTMGPFTARGHVMGYDAIDSQYIYILSYAWMGASGSGVFSENGKLIGYIIAIDVGQTEYGVQVLENVVMVGSSANINWSPLFKQFYE